MTEKDKNINPAPKKIKVTINKRLNKMANTTQSIKKLELANKFGNGKIIRKTPVH
jgi:hypothetical protein